MQTSSICSQPITGSWLVALVLSGLSCTVGCRNSTHVDRVPLEGRVTLDGSPLDGSVLIRPKSDENGDAVIATVTAGRFAFRPSEGPIPGAHVAILMSSGDGKRPNFARSEIEVMVPSQAPFEVSLAFKSMGSLSMPSEPGELSLPVEKSAGMGVTPPESELDN